MNPSATVRDIAALASTPEVKERLEKLAAEFEIQHNQQNNEFGIVIGQLQLRIQEEMEAIRFDMRQAFGDVEARQVKMLEMMEQLQADLHHDHAG